MAKVEHEDGDADEDADAHPSAAAPAADVDASQVSGAKAIEVWLPHMWMLLRSPPAPSPRVGAFLCACPCLAHACSLHLPCSLWHIAQLDHCRVYLQSESTPSKSAADHNDRASEMAAELVGMGFSDEEVAHSSQTIVLPVTLL